MHRQILRPLLGKLGNARVLRGAAFVHKLAVGPPPRLRLMLHLQPASQGLADGSSRSAQGAAAQAARAVPSPRKAGALSHHSPGSPPARLARRCASPPAEKA